MTLASLLDLLIKLWQCLLPSLLALLAGGCGLMAWIPQQTQNTAQSQRQEVNQVGTQTADQINLQPPKPSDPPPVPTSKPAAT
jgi:hypothetical protein